MAQPRLRKHATRRCPCQSTRPPSTIGRAPAQAAGRRADDSWPAGQASPSSALPHLEPGAARAETIMSRLVRALILATMVAVLPLAGMTTIAHAQANDQDTP